ncbi:hypothetical protein [Ilumatobacter sp.]|uniref:hypothetical protein n=1 Tax=Ilumatobacter sp. TaxID=1967498 RepID=UPI003B520F77
MDDTTAPGAPPDAGTGTGAGGSAGRRAGDESTSHDEVVLVTRPDGVVAVQGPTAAVDRLTRRIETVLGSPRATDAVHLATATASGIDVLADAGDDAPTTFRFTRRAMELLRDGEVLPAEDGYLRGVVATGSEVGGPIDWLPIAAGADLLQLQTAAVGLALRASIRSLTDAVDRVERRVDELRDLVRSGQVGEVLGRHRVITERLAMIDGPDGAGLGETDWAAVAHLHPEIVGSLERTRVFVRARMAASEPGRMVRSRVEVAERLVEANLADALGVLATCEHDLAGWQSLRIDRVARTEPDHLDAVLADVEASLELHRVEDQHLVDDLAALIDELMEPTGLEGIEVVHRRRLLRHVQAIHAATVTFARQRDLEVADPVHGVLPGLSDAVGTVARRSVDGGRWALGRIRRRGPGRARADLPLDPRELPPPDPGPDRPPAPGQPPPPVPDQPPPPDPARRAER